MCWMMSWQDENPIHLENPVDKLSFKKSLPVFYGQILRLVYFIFYIINISN